MQEAFTCQQLDDGGVVFNTHCMYPSNGAVQVLVQPVGSGFVVSDGGGAVTEAIAAGASFDRKGASSRFGALARRSGLFFDGGVVRSSSVPVDILPSAIVLVANASKDVADAIFRTWRVKRDEDFKAALKDLLRGEFRFAPKEDQLVGKSTRKHRFENVVSLPSGARAVVDPVLHDANSINSRVVANADVRANADQGIKQAIVYDDSELWGASEVNLLHITAVPVIIPFSSARKSLMPLLLAA